MWLLKSLTLLQKKTKKSIKTNRILALVSQNKSQSGFQGLETSVCEIISAEMCFIMRQVSITVNPSHFYSVQSGRHHNIVAPQSL